MSVFPRLAGRPDLNDDIPGSVPQHVPQLPAPPPTCGFCHRVLNPKEDILYQGMGVLSGLSAAYCGWCGAVLGVGQWTTVIGKRQ